MQKKGNHSGELDKKMAAVCGLYCGACTLYIATMEDPARLKGLAERFQLSGGEFLSLYLRFFYETRKYGRLSKGLILGKGPPTPFGETTEKPAFSKKETTSPYEYASLYESI